MRANLRSYLYTSIASLLISGCIANNGGDQVSGLNVFGGDVAKPGEFMESVFLQMKNPNPHRTCSGIAVDHRTVVTAAHCVLANDIAGNIVAFQTDRMVDQADFDAKKHLARTSEVVVYDRSIDYVSKLSVVQRRQQWARITEKDVAVIVFAANSFKGPFPKLRLEQPKRVEETAFVVGFGAGAIDVRTRRASGYGVKRSGMMSSLKYNPKHAYSITLTRDRRGRYQQGWQGAGPGDSGGGIFAMPIDAKTKDYLTQPVIGVVSHYVEKRVGYTTYFATFYTDSAKSVFDRARAVGAGL